MERRIAPLTRAGWGAKRAFERFPRATYAVARLPITFRALEKLLQGDLPEPGAARGGELAAIRAIYVLSRAAGEKRYCWFPISCMSLNIGRYIEMMMMPTMKPTPIIISGSMIEVRDAIAAVDLVLVEVGDLAQHLLELSRLLADPHHLTDHRREDRVRGERIRDRDALLHLDPRLGQRPLDDPVACGRAGDVERLDDVDAGGDERGKRPQEARHRHLEHDLADLERDLSA